MCMTARGCYVEDVVTDHSLTEFVDKFMTAVYLRNCMGTSEVYMKIIDELGLSKDLDLLLALEMIVREKSEQEKGK